MIFIFAGDNCFGEIVLIVALIPTYFVTAPSAADDTSLAYFAITPLL